jgi:hypothetical protein
MKTEQACNTSLVRAAHAAAQLRRRYMTRVEPSSYPERNEDEHRALPERRDR